MWVADWPGCQGVLAWFVDHRAGRRHDLGRDWPFYEAGEMLLFRRKKLSGS